MGSNMLNSNSSRYEGYYITQGDLHFEAGGKLFRVHSYFFTRESEYWKKLIKPPVSPGEDKNLGLHDSNPFHVNESAKHFAVFLSIFYNQNYGQYKFSLDEWVAILRMAMNWDFPDVCSFAISHIDRMTITLAQRIKIYQEYKVPRRYLLPLYLELVTRERMIEPEEFEVLDTFPRYAIYKAREQLRAPPAPRSKPDSLLSPVRPDIREEAKLHIIAAAFNLSPQEIQVFQPPVTDTRGSPPGAIN